MEALDLAVVTRQPALWHSLAAAFDRILPVEDGAENEAVGLLKPDFGPGYRVRVRLHDGDGAALARWIDTHRPPYTVAFGLARGLPGKHLGPGDVVISKAIPGFDWTARVGRGAGSGAEAEVQTDNNLMRGALGLDAVDQRWIGGNPIPRPVGVRAPRLMAGGVASTASPLAAGLEIDEAHTQAIARRWPKLVAVACDGLDLATAVTRSAVRPRVALLVCVAGLLPGDGRIEDATLRYAAGNGASFLRCWIRHAWPTRPVSAATGQTPKGIRLGDEAVARRSATDSLPRVERVESRPAPEPSAVRRIRRRVSGPLPTAREEARPTDGPRGRSSSPTSGPVSLRARLARLYPTVGDARRVLEEAGLPAEVIGSAGSADVRWHRILEAARRDASGLERLLKVLARDGN